MIIKFSKDIYPKSALIKASYQFTDNFYIYLRQDKKNYIVDIKSKSYREDKGISERFKNELLAQTARQVVINQTSNIREIIMARAFASTVIENEIIDEIKVDAPNSNMEVQSILKNWFDKND